MQGDTGLHVKKLPCQVNNLVRIGRHSRHGTSDCKVSISDAELLGGIAGLTYRGSLAGTNICAAGSPAQDGSAECPCHGRPRRGPRRFVPLPNRPMRLRKPLADQALHQHCTLHVTCYHAGATTGIA